MQDAPITGVDSFFAPSWHIICWRSEQQLKHVSIGVQWGLSFKCNHTEERAEWAYVVAASASFIFIKRGIVLRAWELQQVTVYIYVGRLHKGMARDFH